MSIDRLTELFEINGGSYELAVTRGHVPGAKPFLKIGYNPAVTTSEEDIWSNSGAYVFPVAASQWRIAAGNAADLGTVIKGNAEGAAQTIKCDVGGSETVLIDASVNFTAATGVAVGDLVMLDPKGDVPEFGYITDITDAATGTLVIGGGFSEGGSCATARAYTIVDKSGATGAQALEIYYLTSTFVEKKILVALNAATAVSFNNAAGAALTDTFRLNGMRVIAVGSGGVPVAAISLQLNAGPNTVYGNITLGYNHDRAAIYTVPKGKSLFITSVNYSASTPNDTKIQTARMTVRADMEDYSGFRTPGVFHPFGEAMISNSSELVLTSAMKFTEGVDIKISGIGFTGYTGAMSSVMRGWLELN